MHELQSRAAERKAAYDGVTFALLTQHGKERVIEPLVREVFGASLTVVRDFDTDALGSFTRDVPRCGTQLEAARKKATLALERTGLPLGLGSEGSFGPGPFGLGSWNLELLVLVDADRGIELLGRAYEPGLHDHGFVGTAEELTAFAERAGFPEHGLVLRPDAESDPRIRKGLRASVDLEAAFRAALCESSSGQVFVESDLRAHQHPTRMKTIEKAARDLVARARCLCPACGTPGFGVVARVPGLPCGDCGAPTEEPVADEHGCVKCDRRERRARTGPERAEPMRCQFCNP